MRQKRREKIGRPNKLAERRLNIIAHRINLNGMTEANWKCKQNQSIVGHNEKELWMKWSRPEKKIKINAKKE